MSVKKSKWESDGDDNDTWKNKREFSHIENDIDINFIFLFFISFVGAAATYHSSKTAA